MDLPLALDGRTDLAGQIYRQIRGTILDGGLLPGQALPPSRDLAQTLGVSRNTVTAAYDQLTAQGFVAGRVGAGTYISADLPIGRASDPAAHRAQLSARSVWADYRSAARCRHREPNSTSEPGCPMPRCSRTSPGVG